MGKEMAKPETVKLRVTQGLFRGLASQNMLFHQCIGELVDNSIAATKKGEAFRVDIILDSRNHSSNLVDVWIADNTAGMNLKILGEALQPGGSPTVENRLNEHGFGLKNSLATLCSDSTDDWDIWTRPQGGSVAFHVSGPFDEVMEIEQCAFPRKKFLPEKMSTLIRVQVPIGFISTVQGRGQPTRDLTRLRRWLVEHLGVHYRGYLGADNKLMKPLGEIYVKIKNDAVKVEPLPVPMGEQKWVPFDVELGGENYELTYRYGARDEDKVLNQGHQFYYRGNMATQGIDIRLGNRVIITRQLDTIWDLARDNHYNQFVGELLIPELKRGILKTKTDKTDFNLNDPEWDKIFRYLRDECPPPPKDVDREITEAEMRDEWKRQLEAHKEHGETVGKEINLWETGVRLDLYKKSKNGSTVIWELKRGPAKPLDLYQLKMYWDGLALRGDSPRRAILLAEEFSDGITAMARTMNERLRPPENKKTNGANNRYAFELETLASKGLADSNPVGKKRKKARAKARAKKAR